MGIREVREGVVIEDSERRERVCYRPSERRRLDR